MVPDCHFMCFDVFHLLLQLHREQQSEHASMKIIPMGPGFSAIDNPEDGLEQQLLDVSRKREQLQQAELELRAQFIARSEVHRMQKNYEEQFKQHAEIVASLQVALNEYRFSVKAHVPTYQRCVLST